MVHVDTADSKFSNAEKIIDELDNLYTEVIDWKEIEI